MTESSRCVHRCAYEAVISLFPHLLHFFHRQKPMTQGPIAISVGILIQAASRHRSL